MRVLLVTTGSRGDVEPFAALAAGLARAGHDPLLAAPRRLTEHAADRGVPVAPLDDGIFALQAEVAGKGTRASVTAARSALPLLRRWLDDVATLRDSDADVVVYAPKSLGAHHLADRLGVPSIAALPVPLFSPTARFASPLSPVRPPRFLNRASWRLAGAVEAPYRRMVRTWRSEALGLTGPIPNLTKRVEHDGVLHAWSPHLLPAPDDWPAELAPVGFWSATSDDGWTPPDALARFLGAGEPPVYVGFGSMLAKDPDAFTRTVLDGLRRSGRRAVLATGWGALRPSDVPETVHVLDQAPHDWLLPRTSAAVHHGGVGTVAAALRAGVPQVIKPFLGDQPFWARRTHEIGVAAPPLTGRLTADRLAAALDDAASAAGAARETAALVREEDGVSVAIARIERRVAGG
ncbi:glycosyltransferase [Promicromonospora soli]